MLARNILYYVSRSSINMLIARQFPLKSTEFLAGSPQYNEYTSVIEKVHSINIYNTKINVLFIMFIHAYLNVYT